MQVFIFNLSFIAIKMHSATLHTREASLASTNMLNSAIPTTEHEHHHHHHHHLDHTGLELHTLIGVSLTIGFIFMLLIDQISGGHSHGPSGILV